ncbi:GIY-YIG nuclease family protein [Sulfitobacter albidus]|uniref:GIY-YIG nuclease family protein n=1 Tax=Sulfitobacter albidus TaxID=2829501 RepID=A0A975JG66_9RHOB|nr:GIY-YIG nuclease family protein [Sulfitobacter albidus]
MSDTAFPTFPGKILPHWIEAATAKGFDIMDRIIDRLHVALRCHQCGALIKARLYTVMSAQPLCPYCVQTGWLITAQNAGLTYIDRCPEDRHYAFYEAPCGHKIRRQLELVERVAAGRTGIRCNICHKESETDEATKQGWTLLGPDPEGNPNYRHYQHTDCGHSQRIARANLQTGRLSCGGCGEQWSAAPSHLYAMRFTLPNSRNLVKLGYSKNPESRLHHQLISDPAMPCAILRKVAVPSGQIAIRKEKALHRKFRRDYADAVVDPAIYKGHIKVKSEIYDDRLTETILAELDAIATDFTPRVS